MVLEVGRAVRTKRTEAKWFEKKPQIRDSCDGHTNYIMWTYVRASIKENSPPHHLHSSTISHVQCTLFYVIMSFEKCCVLGTMIISQSFRNPVSFYNLIEEMCPAMLVAKFLHNQHIVKENLRTLCINANGCECW